MACKMIEVARFAPCSGFLYRKQYVVGLARIDGRDAFIINSGTNRANEGNAAAVALNICATIVTTRAENTVIARGDRRQVLPCLICVSKALDRFIKLPAMEQDPKGICATRCPSSSVRGRWMLLDDVAFRVSGRSIGQARRLGP